MSTVMWKFPLAIDDLPHPMPGFVRAAATGPVRSTLTVWVECDDEDPHSPRAAYQVFGTGHQVPAGSTWIATVADPPFIWHVFQIGPNR